MPDKAGTKPHRNDFHIDTAATALVTEMETMDNLGNFAALKVRIVGLVQVIRLGGNANLDPNCYLSLIYLAKTRPLIFRQEAIWKALLTFLGPTRYKRGCTEVSTVWFY